MTSGIAGEDSGVIASPTSTGHGPFEHALGRCPSRYGRHVDKLVAEPGSHWEYSDPAFMHLSPAFATAAGQEMSTYMSRRVFEPIGIESLTWDAQGGSGFVGPHTSPHTGVHISAREMARFGCLMLHDGGWEGQQIIPPWWMELATQTSQDLNPSYEYTWWVNTRGTLWPSLPRDAFALKGYASNKCIIIPSLDTVIVRLGYGPATWNEQGFVGAVVAAILE